MVATVEQAVHADSSCYTGEAGFAIVYLRVASAALGAISAAEAIRQVRAHLDRAAQHGFHRSRFASLLEGTAGYHAVQCVVAHAHGDGASVVTALGAIQRISRDVTKKLNRGESEVLYGRAGYLQSVLAVKAFATVTGFAH